MSACGEGETEDGPGKGDDVGVGLVEVAVDGAHGGQCGMRGRGLDEFREQCEPRRALYEAHNQ